MASASGRRAHQRAAWYGAGQSQHDGALDQRPYLGQLGQLVRAALGHPESAVRYDFDGALDGKLLHRLAHRGRGDPEAGAESRCGVDLPRDQLTVDQGGAQGVEDLAAHGVPLHRHARGGRLAVGVLATRLVRASLFPACLVLARLFPVCLRTTRLLAAWLFGYAYGCRGGRGRDGRVRRSRLPSRAALLHSDLLGLPRARLACAMPLCTIGGADRSSNIDPFG